MKSKKYKFIFLGVVVWVISNFFLSKEVLNPFFTIISISFLFLICYDLIKNNLEFAPPSIFVFIIDIIGLSTIISGLLVDVDYSNVFVYTFILCTLIFIFTGPRVYEDKNSHE